MTNNRIRELCHEILSAITATPSLIAAGELTPDDFPEGRLRETFKAIDAEWQDSGPDVIDPGRLANRLGPNTDMVFLGSLFDGAIVIKAEFFLDLITELRKKAGGLRIVGKIERQARSPAGIDEAEIRKDYEELDHYGGSPRAASLSRPAFDGTLTDFFNADLPEAEVLIEGLLAREEFMLMGGVKHAHKTTAMMDLGLNYASGRREWLNFLIHKPGRFLMIQQELGEAEFRKRLRKAVDAGHFEPDNFFPYTTTSDPIKIIEDVGFDRLRKLCDKRQPDIIGLDPLHTFMTGGENKDDAFAKVRDRVNYLKTTYKCAVVLSHHFSSKRPKEDPDAPAEVAGFFRGHSVLADAADVLFCLFRLPGQKDNPNLRLAYEDYNQVEATLRNGKWPPRFAVEFDGDTFLLSVSDVWHEVGAKIGFGEIRELCKAHGDSITLANAIIYFKARDRELSPHTVKKAVDREVQAGYVITEPMPGKGRPILIKSK